MYEVPGTIKKRCLVIGIDNAVSIARLSLYLGAEVMAEVGAHRVSLYGGAVSSGIDIADRKRRLEGNVLLTDIGTCIDEQQLLCKLRVRSSIEPLIYLVVLLTVSVVKDLRIICGIKFQPGPVSSDRNCRGNVGDP